MVRHSGPRHDWDDHHADPASFVVAWALSRRMPVYSEDDLPGWLGAGRRQAGETVSDQERPAARLESGRPQRVQSAACAFDRHRGGGHPPTPATPPCIRVRTRRFELVTSAFPRTLTEGRAI